MATVTEPGNRRRVHLKATHTAAADRMFTAHRSGPAAPGVCCQAAVQRPVEDLSDKSCRTGLHTLRMAKLM